jgi:hypothetical protein
MALLVAIGKWHGSLPVATKIMVWNLECDLIFFISKNRTIACLISTPSGGT